MTKLFLSLAGALTLAVFCVSAWILVERLTQAKTLSGEGVIAAPANTGGPFELTSHTGRPVNQDTFKGNYALVYFGYSFCPDICPTGLQNIAAGLEKLGDKARAVTPIFISLDPARDTPDHLSRYVELFHPGMIGMTGTPAQIKDVARKFRVFYALRTDLDQEDYPVDHSSFTYLMDPDWKLIAIFQHNATPQNFADILHNLL